MANTYPPRVNRTGKMTTPRGAPPRLHGWLHPAVLSAAALSVAAGAAQFGVTVTLPDVAAAFGEVAAELGPDASLVAQIGLSTTALGVGLAVIRLASLGALPLANAADHFGRRRLLLFCSAAGLALTAVASRSPSYAWFVVVVALGRPVLSTTNIVAGVVAAEETTSRDRAKAMALITAAYGVGAGLPALLRGLAGTALSFRALFAMALIPLALLPLAARFLDEPDRYLAARSRATARTLGHVPPAYRQRLGLLALLTFAVTFVTGPVNAYLFVYAESVVGLTRGTTGLLTLMAGVIGLTGLLLGRWAADRLGRRGTAALAQLGLALGGIVTYSGGGVLAIAGYLTSIFAGSTYAPAIGALSAEVFPTAVRATAAGWLTVSGVLGAVAGLVAFGALADAFASFAPAALIVCAPVMLASAIYLALPETRGMELEESAPDLV